MGSVNTSEGINAIKSGKFEEAFTKLHKAFFIEGDTMAGCYLAMMYFDVKITPRTPESQAKAMIIWNMTKDRVISSRHKLGVNLYGSKNPQTKNLGYQYISEAAQGGYSVAHCVLGMLYHSGGQYDKAEKELLKYENVRNDKRACIALADCLIRNNHLAGSNSNLAIEILEIAINKFGDTSKKEAYISAIENDTSDSSRKRLLAIYEEKAQNGDVSSILQLADILYWGKLNGKDVPEIINHEKAFEYLKLGADTYNDANCMFHYTELLYDDVHHHDEVSYKDKQDLFRKEINYAIRAVKSGYEDRESFLATLYSFIEDYENEYIYARENYFRFKNGETLKRYDSATDLWYKIKTKTVVGGVADYYDPMVKECLDQELIYNSDNSHDKLYRLFLYPVYLFLVEGADGVMQAYDYFMNFPYFDDYEACLAIGALEGYYKDPTDKKELVDKLFELADENGPSNAIAQFGYGNIMRYNGYYSNAVEYYLKSYAKGVRRAAFCLSDMYLKGEVTGRKDKKKAAEWDRKFRGE
jgi:TPR repeat protein